MVKAWLIIFIIKINFKKYILLKKQNNNIKIIKFFIKFRNFLQKSGTMLNFKLMKLLKINKN